jgi:hypothetical protein
VPLIALHRPGSGSGSSLKAVASASTREIAYLSPRVRRGAAGET